MHIPLNCAGDQGHCSLPPWSLLIASTTTEKTSLFFVELALQNKTKQLWGQRKKLANVNYKHGVISHLRLKKAVNTTDEKQASYCVTLPFLQIESLKICIVVHQWFVHLVKFSMKHTSKRKRLSIVSVCSLKMFPLALNTN